MYEGVMYVYYLRTLIFEDKTNQKRTFFNFNKIRTEQNVLYFI